MQAVATQYAPYADARWSDIRVTFRLVDVDAAREARATVSSNARISQPGQLTDEKEEAGTRGAMLALNAWTLDGGKTIYPDSVAGLQTGWCSGVLSGENTAFPAPERLRFDFTTDQSSVGFTITFGDGIACDLEVTAYDAAGQVLAARRVENHSRVCIVDLPVENYRRVDVAFYQTAWPWCPVQVLEVLFGIVQHFDKHNATELRLTYEMDPAGESQPTQEMRVTIDNRDHRYNLVNPSGVYAFLQQGQALDVALGVGGARDEVELVNMGRFYFTEAQAEDDGMTAEITAHDPLHSMTGQYRKGVRGTARLGDLLAAIVADSGRELTIDIPAQLAGRLVGGNVPLVEHREALRMACQAARCCCWVAREDVLVVREPVVAAPVDVLDRDNMAAVPKITVGEPINTAEVVSCTLTRDGEAKESDLATVELAVEGITEVWIPLNGPAAETTVWVEGADVLSTDHYLYACRATLEGSGLATVTVSGIRLDQMESVSQYSDQREGEPERVARMQNELVLPGEAQAVARWYLDQCRQRVGYAIQERGNPAREVGDTARVQDAYDANRRALILREEYAYDGTLSATTAARGEAL